MLSLNGLEQALEVTSSKALKVIPLNNLNKDGRAVHEGLGEDLQQIAALIVVDEDAEALDRVQVLLELPAALLRLEALAHGVIVRGGDVDEVDAARAQGRDGGDDVRREEGDVLDARARVEDDVLLDLGHLLARSGLVDGHLDNVVGRGHDDGAQGRELGADLGVIHRPEAVEGEALLVKGTGRNHLVPRLVSDAVVDADEGHVGHLHGGSALVTSAESGEERPSVASAVDECVCGITICADDGRGDGAVVILGGGWALDGDGAFGHSLVIDARDVVNLKGNVLDGITVPLKVSMHGLQESPVRVGDGLIRREVGLRSNGRREDEANAIVGDDI